MKIRTLAIALLSVAATMSGLTAATANAATLVITGDGTLTGATGVTIGNKIYDVGFRDGTCMQVYGTCTKASFAFELMSDAREAATALLNQVFIDSPSGRFDSNPGLTFGCTGTVCNTLITYGSGGNFGFSAGVATNRDTDLDTSDATGSRAVRFDSASLPDYNFARFTFVGMVPEPATWAMMIAGFGVVGGSLRRKRKVATTVRFA